jgi:hypothetical protein
MKTNDFLIISIIIIQIIIILKLIFKGKKENFTNLDCETIINKFEDMCMPYAYPPRVGKDCDTIYPSYLRCTKQ